MICIDLRRYEYNLCLFVTSKQIKFLLFDLQIILERRPNALNLNQNVTFMKNLYDIDLEIGPKRLNLIEEKYMIFKSRRYIFDVLVVFFYIENALGVNEY